jgi:adenylylsulfate kinase
MLIVMAGLPGTGKSTIARRLADALPGIILDKDRIRATLFPPSEIEYSTRQDDFCVRIMLQVAEYVLCVDPEKHVILDGRTYSRRYQVDAVRQFARERNVSFKLVECVCADRTIKRRLDRDVAEGRHPATNRNYDMYLAVKARFEPISAPKLVVDTDEPLDGCVQCALDYILKG